ncbi:MAG TPA: hypothetical protein VNE42_05315 [Acidimicrobiales bacterium]|nr:hypothetical protein [Acidimicrobiales bacterium]
MPTFPFLSDEWIAAAQEIYSAASQRVDRESGGSGPGITMNLIVKNAPFHSDNILANVDNRDGVFRIALGPLGEAEVKLTLDYKIARSILLDGDAQVGMRAFLSGKIRVEGNMTKLLALRNSASTPDEEATLDALRAITASED